MVLALEGPASEVLWDLDTSQPQAYSLIWETLARRFGSLDASLKRRFEDGLISTEMIQFLRLHARDLDFYATVIKARQFADATDQSRAKKRVNFIDTRPKSPAQPER